MTLERSPDVNKTSVAKSLFWVAYTQVAGVLGALGMIVFWSHFVVFDWHGVVASLFSFWTGSVRPLVGLVLAATVEPLAHVVGLDLAVPVIVKDYLGAGFVLAFSFLRAIYVAGDMGSFWQLDLRGKAKALVAVFLLLPLIWPLMVVAFPANLLWLAWNGAAPAGATRRTLLLLTPVVYVAVLLALGAWVG